MLSSPVRIHLNHGAPASLLLELPAALHVAELGHPLGEPISNVEQALRQALAAPVEFPPLTEAVFAGDRVVLAIDAALPQGARMAAAVVNVLLEADIQPAAITIALTKPRMFSLAKLRALLPEAACNAMEFLSHDPRDDQMLSQLASTEAGRPIMFNRRLCDADMVVSLAAMRNEDALAYGGPHAALFPAFADAETIRRHRGPSQAMTLTGRDQRFAEAHEAAWQLGARFSVQVVPGEGDNLLHVVAGDGLPTYERGRELYRAAWSCSPPARSSLVIAGVSAPGLRQTWNDFARALRAAEQLAADGATIVLCSELHRPIGAALRDLAAARESSTAGFATTTLTRLRRRAGRDAVAAMQLAETLSQARVYLLGPLPVEQVEELGMAHVATPHEIEVLARSFSSCVVLHNADRVIIARE